ncbi:(Fe-S)-binding protein [Sulfobacillus thermosulfidooxidans]|uniref:(Fe-S)-binding protein n=1 Tax=Sulfobacillus thermosulfidooxidans TaxID=28034 RepID=UPI0006B40B21|nr:(Fe-S)-binding protein [Sulfobacillus thermosulfidooxidans]
MQKRVQLFVTCLVDLVHPQAAMAAVHVLERRHVSVEFPENQTCCGQFSYNAGYHHEAAILARHFLTVFEAGSDGEPPDIVSLSGSCAAMVIQIYPQLLYDEALAEGEPEEMAESWKHRAVQLGQRLQEWTLWLGQHFPSESVTTPKLPVAYHLGCHMRRLLPSAKDTAQILGHYGIEAIEPDDADQCCGFGGTYSFTEPIISTTLADEKWQHLDQLRQSTGALCLTSADLGCLLHLKGRFMRQGYTFPACHVAELVDLADRKRLTAERIQATGFQGGR